MPGLWNVILVYRVIDKFPGAAEQAGCFDDNQIKVEKGSTMTVSPSETP